jgi:PAS domain S-box-containing protein
MEPESELERLVQDRTRQLEDDNESLRRREQIHATELQTLQQVATQDVKLYGIDSLYEQILDTVLAILHADFASIQRFYPERGNRGELKLLGHRGFSAEAAQRWGWINSNSRTLCGEALRTGRKVVILDIRNCDLLVGEDLDGYLGEGIRAGQTFPLVSRSGALMGMVSAYWRDVHEMSVSEAHALDILARLAADVIERSRAEESLRAALEELRLITDNMAAVVSRCSRDLRYLWVSPSYAALLKEPGPDAIAGRSISDVLGEEGFESIWPHILKALSGSRVEFETRMTYPEAGRRWIHAVYVPTRDHNHAVDGWIAVITDVTERHEAEDRLRQSEERFRKVADTAPVMIWVSGPDKLFTFVNRGWLDFTGGTMERELGDGWADDVHPDDFEGCLATYISSFDARCSFQREYRLRRVDGVYRWILDRGVPLFGSGGGFQGYIGSCVDITELKLAQEATLSRQKMESVGMLAAGIAHDFGNLMGGIVAETDFALEELAAGSPAAKEVQKIQTIAFRASEIVRELMVYSGQETASYEALQISRLIEDMAELLKLSIPKRVTLKVECEKDLPSIKGNASRIRQVVMNLIINASEAIGEESGTITVSASHVTGGKELAPGSAMELSDGDYVRLEVSDTGPGMTEQQRTRIFDPFFTTKSTGRGLGLAVVQGVVRSHDGAINVLSVPGGGTTFQVFLPTSVQAEREGKTAATDTPAQKVRSAGTVLLVEDEESLRVPIAKTLRNEHFAVIEAVDGSSAIRLLSEHKNEIDLILLDLSIPGSTSREVMETAQQIRPDVKVLIMSAHNENIARNSIDLEKTTAYIRKPFRLAELVRMIREI